MLTYTGGRNLYGKLTNDSGSTNLTDGDVLINLENRAILTSQAWPFLEKSATGTTTASTQYVAEPADIRILLTVSVTVGTTVYTPKEVKDRRSWDILNTSSTTSDTPEFFYRVNGRTYFYPTPATSSNTVTWNYLPTVKDLSIADYTTGGVLSVANAGTAVVGTGTTWAVSMAGRYLRITESDTANKGDGQWYEISASGSATTITLVKAYQGTAISAGNAAYTIGQVSQLPEAYQEIPVFRAVATYWRSKDEDRAKYFTDAANELEARLREAYGSKTGDYVLDDGEDEPLINPNLTIRL